MRTSALRNSKLVGWENSVGLPRILRSKALGYVGFGAQSFKALRPCRTNVKSGFYRQTQDPQQNYVCTTKARKKSNGKMCWKLKRWKPMRNKCDANPKWCSFKISCKSEKKRKKTAESHGTKDTRSVLITIAAIMKRQSSLLSFFQYSMLWVACCFRSFAYSFLVRSSFFQALFLRVHFPNTCW